MALPLYSLPGFTLRFVPLRCLVPALRQRSLQTPLSVHVFVLAAFLDPVESLLLAVFDKVAGLLRFVNGHPRQAFGAERDRRTWMERAFMNAERWERENRSLVSGVIILYVCLGTSP